MCALAQNDTFIGDSCASDIGLLLRMTYNNDTIRGRFHAGETAPDFYAMSFFVYFQNARKIAMAPVAMPTAR